MQQTGKCFLYNFEFIPKTQDIDYSVIQSSCTQPTNDEKLTFKLAFEVLFVSVSYKKNFMFWYKIKKNRCTILLRNEKDHITSLIQIIALQREVTICNKTMASHCIQISNCIFSITVGYSDLNNVEQIMFMMHSHCN